MIIRVQNFMTKKAGLHNNENDEFEFSYHLEKDDVYHEVLRYD